MITKSAEVDKLFSALVKFQSEMTAVKKDAINPFFKSKYADLASIIEALRKPLADNGLGFSQFPTGKDELTTIVFHVSGQYVEGHYPMSPVDNKPQSVGSAMTYARRYALGAALGIATEEDDDGNSASAPGTPAAAPTAFTPPKATHKAAKTPPVSGKPDMYGACDNAACSNKANLRFGKLCYPCSLEAKKGVTFNLRSEGAADPIAVTDAPAGEVDESDIPF